MLLKRSGVMVERWSHRIGHSRVWGVLLWGILSVGGMGCGKEHEVPVAFHKTLLGTPSHLKAKFVEDQRIVLTWTMSDMTNVAGYAVFMSNSDGPLREVLVDTTAYIEESSLTTGAVDSTWYYFRVSAVDANLFRGPSSPVDSVLVH